MSNEANAVKAGLEGAVAASSSISYIDGNIGKLIYGGYNIHDLAKHSTFEEVVYLLWNSRLPGQSELDELKAQLNKESGIPSEIHQLIRSLPTGVNPMDMLRTVVSALSFYDPDGQDMSREANVRKAIRLTAKFPTLVAAFQRIRNGLEPIEPRGDLTISGNFLYTLRGEVPDEVAT